MNPKYTLEESALKKQLTTPVLFIVFNRPDTTKQVFDAIKLAQPSKLYVAADGPRYDNLEDIDRIHKVKEIIFKNIDWDCEVKTLFREENYGCGRAVKTAIDWLFESEDVGIVLEDDVVPDRSFFYYCEELLYKYKNDIRIAMISGINHVDYKPADASYLFSKNKGCWGWATWKRSWLNMDFEMKWRDTFQRELIIKNMGISKYYLDYWQNALRLIDRNEVNAWDWQWYFSISAQNQLCIFPETNLIKNIGFGSEATHTKGKGRYEFSKYNQIKFPLKHPIYICPDSQFDELVEYSDMRVSLKRKIVKAIPYKFRKFLRTIIGLK